MRDRQLNQHVLQRWRKYLRESKASGEPVFRLWHAAAAIPSGQFAAALPATRSAAKVPGLLETELSGKTVSSLQDWAAYAAALTKCDRAEPFDDPERQQFRAVLRGPTSPADVPVDEFELIYTEGDSNNTRSIRVRYNTMLAQAAYDGAPPRAMAVEDLPSPVPGHVFLRGNPNNPGAPAPPRFLTCLGGGDDKIFRNGSGRLELAQAIIDPANPLTARVIVNRVWMHHFGFGIVRTPSDFGFRGDPPTHPELLDYLAVKFVESGWSLKQLHRLIMTSAAYRQSSADNEAARKLGPGKPIALENEPPASGNRKRPRLHAGRRGAPGSHGRRRSLLPHSPTFDSPPFGLRLHRARARAGSAERVRLRFTGSARALALRNHRSPAGALFPEQPVRRRTIQRARKPLRDCRGIKPLGKDRSHVRTGLGPWSGSTGVGGRLEIRFPGAEPPRRGAADRRGSTGPAGSMPPADGSNPSRRLRYSYPSAGREAPCCRHPGGKARAAGDWRRAGRTATKP